MDKLFKVINLTGQELPHQPIGEEVKNFGMLYGVRNFDLLNRRFFSIENYTVGSNRFNNIIRQKKEILSIVVYSLAAIVSREYGNAALVFIFNTKEKSDLVMDYAKKIGVYVGYVCENHTKGGVVKEIMFDYPNISGFKKLG